MKVPIIPDVCDNAVAQERTGEDVITLMLDIVFGDCYPLVIIDALHLDYTTVAHKGEDNEPS